MSVSSYPKTIWLQRDFHEDDDALEFNPVKHEITWSQDQINDSDVRYVRADLTDKTENKMNDTHRNVTITLPHDAADKTQNDLSDFLCWITGYNAGSRPDGDGYPFDIDAIRDLNIKLKRAVK